VELCLREIVDPGSVGVVQVYISNVFIVSQATVCLAAPRISAVNAITSAGLVPGGCEVSLGVAKEDGVGMTVGVHGTTAVASFLSISTFAESIHRIKDCIIAVVFPVTVRSVSPVDAIIA